MTVRFGIILTFICGLLAGAPAISADFSELKIISGDKIHQFDVEVANTPSLRSKGLMFRSEMAEDKGMLFDFGRTLDVTMWMKNTEIPLDMLFADSSGIIITIARETEPYSTRVISSGGKVKYVLEILGGVADRLGLKVGDKLQHYLIKTK